MNRSHIPWSPRLIVAWTLHFGLPLQAALIAHGYPGPSEAFAFLSERERSLDDGHFGSRAQRDAWIHNWPASSWSGLLLGAYLLAVGLTGSVIPFRGEIENALRPELTRVTPRQTPAPLQPMLDSVYRLEPGARFRTVDLPIHPRQSLSIWGHDAQGRSFHIYFNPWTGVHLGQDVTGDTLSEWLYELHANLLGGSTGELIHGISEVYSVRKRLPGEWRLDGVNSIHVDPQSGAIVRADLHRKKTPAQRLLRTFFPLHAGTFWGTPTRVLWVLLGLTPGMLMISGTLLWWNRVVRSASLRRQSLRVSVTDSQTLRSA